MKFLISPAKTLDLTSAPTVSQFSSPELLDEAQQLITTIKPYTPADIASLMKLSDKLSMLNVNRFQHWATPFTPDNARPAMYAFKGDVYTGLDAYSLKKADVNFAQKHLRMLSGLYGLLKPLDLMQPYRLEMGTKFSNQRGANLYEFWGDRITQKINEEAAAKDVVLNLASTLPSQTILSMSCIE